MVRCMRNRKLKIRSTLVTFGFLTSLFISIPQANANFPANTLCNNGTISKSSGRGTCSWNGGIAGNGSSRNNGFDPYGTSSRSNQIDPYRIDPYGTSSRSNKVDPFGTSSRSNKVDPFGTSSRSKTICSYIDRSKGRC